MEAKESFENTSKDNNDSSEAENTEEILNEKSQKDSRLDEDTICGFGCFKPRWMQQYATPKVFVTLFSLIGVIEGCYYPYYSSSISTLEKRFAFTTKISGTLLLADELTPIFTGVLVGYIGGKTHRPRMVTIGMLMAAACCFLSGLPYLIYGPAKHLPSTNYKNQTGLQFCDVEGKSERCDTDDAPPTTTVVGILLFGSIIKGFATITYFVTGVTYLDDNVKKKDSPMYLTVSIVLKLTGPLIGYLMASAFLKLYENPLEDPGYGPDDPRWVGAWWIGFFLQGFLLVILSLPLALFPRVMPGHHGRVKKIAATSRKDGGIKGIFLDFFSSMKRMGTYPVYVLIVFNTILRVFGQYAHSIMLPKYMENQFRLTASQASLYSGAASIAFIMVSTLFGGYMVWKFRPRIKLLLIGMILSEIILCIGYLLLLIPRCETADMMNFGMNDEGLILKSSCNEMCDCTTKAYTPFCGPDGITYFSPCYAGCTEDTVSSTPQKEFHNCSCVSTSGNQSTASILSEGVCPDENCWNQALAYLIIYFIMLTVSDAFHIPLSMLMLRSIHPRDKSLALGTFETSVSLFGLVPFPITFGALIDSACLVWEKNCEDTGNCWFYDIQKYSTLLHGVVALFTFFSVLCFIGMYFKRQTVQDLYVDDVEKEEKEYKVVIKLDTVPGSATKL